VKANVESNKVVFFDSNRNQLDGVISNMKQHESDVIL